MAFVSIDVAAVSEPDNEIPIDQAFELSRGSMIGNYLDGYIDEDSLFPSQGQDHSQKESTEPQRPFPSAAHSLPRNYPELMQEISNSSVKKTPLETWDVGIVLGEGYTWRVHEGCLKNTDGGTGVKVALKFLRLEVGSNDVFDIETKLAAAFSEIRILSHRVLRANKNIVNLRGISFQSFPLGFAGRQIFLPVLIEELADLNEEGRPYTLQEVISSPGWHLSPRTQMSYLLDVANGLADLHDLNILHGDLKPSNVLMFQRLAERPIAKLSDFGFCEALDNEAPAKGDSPYWAAPECLPGAHPDLREFRSSVTRDLYSFGLLIWYVLIRAPPFGDEELLDPSKIANMKTQESLKNEIEQAVDRIHRFRFNHLLGLPATQALRAEIMFEFDEKDWNRTKVAMKNFQRAVSHHQLSEEYWKVDGTWENSLGVDEMWVIPILSFFAAYFTVREPTLRIGLRFFTEMCDEEWVLKEGGVASKVQPGRLFRDIVMANSLMDHEHDFLWSEFFCPSRRRILLDDIDSKALRGSQCRLLVLLCAVRLNREKRIMNSLTEHRITMTTHVALPMAYDVDKFVDLPQEIPSLVVQCLVEKSQNIPKSLSTPTLILLGMCHYLGFGAPKSQLAARRCFLTAAGLGAIVAKGLLLRYYPLQELLELTSLDQLTRWYAESFGLMAHDTRLEGVDEVINRQGAVLCAADALLSLSDEGLLETLSLCFKTYFQSGRRFAWQKPDYKSWLADELGTHYTPNGGSIHIWETIQDFFEKEDLGRLRRFFWLFPQFHQQKDGQPSLLHLAVLTERLSVARMLVKEYQMDPTALDDSGLSSIAIAAFSSSDVFSKMHMLVLQTRFSLARVNIPLLLMLNTYLGTPESIGWVITLASIKASRAAIAGGKKLKDTHQEDYISESIEQIGRPLLECAVVWAIWADNVGALAKLLEYRPRINRRFRDIHYLGALHCAAERMKPLLVVHLLAAGARTDLVASAGRSPLHLACSSYQSSRDPWDPGCRTSLISQDVLSDGIMCVNHEPPHFPDRWRLFHLQEEPPAGEIKGAQEFCVKLLLCYGSDVNARDDNGRTPLAYSLGTEAYGIAELLLDHGADINSTSEVGMTPLHEAYLLFCRPTQVEFCLRAGADPNRKDVLGRTLLHIAAHGGNLEISRLLLLAGADIAAVDADNANCFHQAYLSRDEALIEYFLDVMEGYGLEAVADILGSFDFEGLNSLTYCIWPPTRPSPEICTRIFGLAASSGILNCQNASGYTALHIAVSFGEPNTVQELIAHGADASIKDTIFGWTPVHHAAMSSTSNAMTSLNVFMKTNQFAEVPDELMGWTPGQLVFWVHLTQSLNGLDPASYWKGDRFRRFVNRAVQESQIKSEGRKRNKPRVDFVDISVRHLERLRVLRWKPGTRPIQLPPFDVFFGEDEHNLDYITKTHPSTPNHAQEDNRLLRRTLNSYYPNSPIGHKVRIFDRYGRHRGQTLLHLMPRRTWRIWTADQSGLIQIGR